MERPWAAEKREEDWMQKTLGMLLLMLFVAGCCMAGTPPPTPEIDPSSVGSAIAAIALVGGALLVIRGRKK